MKERKMKIKLIHLKLFFIPFLLLAFNVPSICQEVRTEVAGIPINYDESQVPDYSLPDPLMLLNGQPVDDPETWHSKRRHEILSLFENEQFGKSPNRNNVRFNVFDSGTLVYNETAVRKQLAIYFTDDTSNYKADLLIYLPVNSKEPAPPYF